MKEGRKTLQINESVFNEFNSRKDALGVKNASDCLQELLSQEMHKTIIIEKGMSFSNCEKMQNRIEKEGEK